MSQSDEHNSRGIDLADRGWLDEAVKEFKKAINLDGKSAHAHDNLGTVLAEKGELLDALMEYVEAVRADPQNPGAHHYLASFIAGQGQDLAIAEYRHALELDFEQPNTHLNLALALAETGRLDDAINELEIAYKQAPDDEMIQHELACCLIDIERYPDAIGHLRQIIKRFPDHVEAYVDLGIAYTAQGFCAEAERTFLEALEADEHDFAAHYHMAALYAGWGKGDKAMEHLKEAAERDDERVGAWLKEDRMFDSMQDDERLLRFLQ